MSAGLKPYPVYRDSGVEWLGDVPDHWGLPRLGSLLRERRETNDNGSVADVLSVMKDVGVIPYEEKGNVGNKKSDDITRYKIVRPDDIVVNCMNVIIGSVGLSRYTGCLSPVYYVLTRRSGADDPHFLGLCFQAKPFQRSLVRIGNGILAHRMRIPMELLKCELLPHPSLDEQAAIVRYLGYMDSRIRRSIHAKKKLIKLLDEQKQVIIHEAVTGQIDVRTGKPYSAYRDSGVESLGEVPEHWEVRRLGAMGRLFKGNGGTKEDEAPAGVPCVRYGDIYMHHRFFVRETRSCVALERASDYTPIRYGDLLFAGSGETIEEIGKSVACLIESPACCGGDVVVLRPSVESDAQFMGYATDSRQAVAQKSRMGRGITVMHVYGDQLKNLWLALPPVPEQAAIVGFLEDAIASADSAIAHARSEIDLLREYRTRLIADVVSGKLDVREAAENLPDEAEQAEPVADEDLLADDSEVDETDQEEAAYEEVEV